MKNSAGFYKTMHLIENQIHVACNIRNNHTGFGIRLDGKLNILFKPWPPGIRRKTFCWFTVHHTSKWKKTTSIWNTFIKNKDTPPCIILEATKYMNVLSLFYVTPVFFFTFYYTRVVPNQETRVPSYKYEYIHVVM